MAEPPAPRGRRKPAREHVSRAEKAVCVLLLALIPAAAAGIYLKGQRYDPGLYSLDPSLVRATARRIPSHAAGPDQGEDTAGAPPVAPTAPAAAPSAPGFAVPGVAPSGALTPPALPGLPLPGLAPTQVTATPTQASGGATAAAPAARGPLLAASFGDASWARSGAIQHFTAANLFEKINGRAEEYLQFGVVALDTVTYTDRREEGRFLDAFVYDMGKPANAFGIFSMERGRGAQPVALGEKGYRAGASCFFIRGRHYVQVVASDKGALLEEAGLKLARQLDAGLAPAAAPAQAAPAPPGVKPPSGAPSPAAAQPAPQATQPKPIAKSVAARPKPAAPATATERAAPDFSSPEALLALFPKEDAVADTGQFLAKDALGLDFLAAVATTRYKLGDAEYTLFLTRRESETEARALVDRYVEFLGQFGKLHDRRADGGITFLVGNVAGFYDAVFRAGPFFGGVNAASDRTAAAGLAVRLLHSVAEGVGDLVPRGARKLERWPGVPAPAQPAPGAMTDEEGDQ